MDKLLTVLLVIVGTVAGAVCVFALCSPVEILAWWTGRGTARSRADSPIIPASLPPAGASDPPVQKYVVYLSGVGRSSGEDVPDKEGAFLDSVCVKVPGLVMVRDVFPYSPSNTPLTEHRPLVRFWAWIPRVARRHRRLMILYHIIYFHNLLKTAASRDPRYGPVLSYGVAKEILRGLLRNGYRLDQPRPVTVVCISGGGQVAQGAAPYLRRWLGAPISMVSVGSVLTDEIGCADIEHIYHLSGCKDITQFVGRVLGPRCWRIFPHSVWNTMRAEGRIETIPMGPMKHMGWGDYFSRSVKLPDGRSHAEFTAEVVASLLNGQKHPGYRAVLTETRPVNAHAASVDALPSVAKGG